VLNVSPTCYISYSVNIDAYILCRYACVLPICLSSIRCVSLSFVPSIQFVAVLLYVRRSLLLFLLVFRFVVLFLVILFAVMFFLMLLLVGCIVQFVI
jgi:hypothetical protein